MCELCQNMLVCALQGKEETLGHMVMAAIEILGYKHMTDFWGLQRWRQKLAKKKRPDQHSSGHPQPHAGVSLLA